MSILPTSPQINWYPPEWHEFGIIKICCGFGQYIAKSVFSNLVLFIIIFNIFNQNKECYFVYWVFHLAFRHCCLEIIEFF